MEQTEHQSAGPNPLCEVGRNHPRDRHRMRPVSGQVGLWHCGRHGMFARIMPKGEAEALDRGDTVAMDDGSDGEVVRLGDERPGGMIVYYRPAE